MLNATVFLMLFLSVNHKLSKIKMICVFINSLPTASVFATWSSPADGDFWLNTFLSLSSFTVWNRYIVLGHHFIEAIADGATSSKLILLEFQITVKTISTTPVHTDRGGEPQLEW